MYISIKFILRWSSDRAISVNLQWPRHPLSTYVYITTTTKKIPTLILSWIMHDDDDNVVLVIIRLMPYQSADRKPVLRLRVRELYLKLSPFLIDYSSCLSPTSKCPYVCSCIMIYCRPTTRRQVLFDLCDVESQLEWRIDPCMKNPRH